MAFIELKNKVLNSLKKLTSPPEPWRRRNNHCGHRKNEELI